MLKRLFFIGAILSTTFTFAQKKELSLSDAVMQQYRMFAPETMPFFQWIPNTSEFTYIDGYKKLMKASVKDTTKRQLFTIEEVNKILDSKLQWFSGFEWKNQTTFYLNDGANYYSFDVSTKTGKKLIALDENAENSTFNQATEKMAYTIENNLWVTDAAGKKMAITQITDKNIVSGQTYARSEFGIHGGIFWSPKGTLLAFAQKDETDVHDYPLLDITPTPGELHSIKYPMTGQKSEKSKIGIYNFATGTTVFIAPQGKPDDYLTNVCWTPDEKFILIAEVNREQNHMWLNKYDAATGKLIKTLFEETNDKWVEPEHPAFFPSETSNNFVWISERDGFNNLYFYDIEGTLIKQLTANKFVVKDILTAVNKSSEIVFSATGDSPLNTMYYTVNMKGTQRLLTTVPGSHTVYINSAGNWIFDEYSSHTIPSRSVLYTYRGEGFIELKLAKNKLADYKIGTSEISTIKSANGMDLYTRLIKPSNFDPAKKYPVLVYVYGGPHAQLVTNEWLDGANLWMYWMAEQGYLVYTLDNRGSAERGFEFESGIHRQCGTIEMEDQIAGVNYLKSLPYVDGNRLAVHGWSYGGFMTTSLALRYPDVFKVAVAGGPVTDWKYYEIMYGERYMDKPDENPEGYKQASLMTHASKLKAELLLIHGTNDDVVVMQHNFALVKKFVELGIQMDFFPYPMHPHNVGGKDRVHLMTKVLNYVIENNK